MVRTILISILCGICGLALAAAGNQWLIHRSDASQGAKPPDSKLPFAGQPPPKELQVLAPLLGKWKTTGEGPPTMRFKNGYTETGKMITQWSHNGHFLRSEGHFLRTADGMKTQINGTVLMTYDRNKKVYRRWLFTSEGFASEMEGRWDESTKTMTFKFVTLPPNASGEGKLVLQKDRYQFDFAVRSNGKLLSALKATAQREE